MSLDLTSNARRATQRSNLTPNLVLEIDGVETKYGAIPILAFIRIGDPDLFIGNDWEIGGTRPIQNQNDLVTFEGTTTTIQQKLDIDKASGTSVSQMAVALVDIGGEITQLTTPGEIVDDVLGRKAIVWLGFGDISFPQDYVIIFRGIIDDVKSDVGKITLQISHPDQLKRQDIFVKASSVLDGSINDSQTTIDLADASQFMYPILGPDNTYDSSISYGVRIEDEVIFYTGITGNQLTGCTRGALFTTADSHDDESAVDAFVRLTGNSIDLALKVMLSGWNGYYLEDFTDEL